MKKLVLLLLLLFAPWSEAANYMCGQDLNGDGFVDTENETASCIVSPQGQSCPIGKTACISEISREETPAIPKCPTGTTLKDEICIGEPAWAEHYQIFQTMAWTISGELRVIINQTVSQYKTYSLSYLSNGQNFNHNGHTVKIGKYKQTSGESNFYSVMVKVGDATSTSPTYDCTLDSYFDPRFGKCYKDISVDVCPLDGNLACVGNGGSSYCSPNPCVDLETQEPIENGSFDDKMLIDDGDRDENGACLDQLYIFNGKHSECRPSGFDTAFKNCCKSKGSALHDGAGSVYSMYGGVQTVKKLYSIGKIAHTAYTAQVAAGVPVDFAAELAVGAAKQQAALMFNPTTMAISVAMYFVMDYLMQACEQSDLEAAMMNDSGYCHYVGEYCKKEWPLIGCVQKAKSFCCFNSKLARIIHQQGRPQLTTFNAWGPPESPDCRGFKPEEFQSLDFSRIDLAEYYDDLVHKTQKEMADTMKKVSEEFYEHTISNASK